MIYIKKNNGIVNLSSNWRVIFIDPPSETNGVKLWRVIVQIAKEDHLWLSEHKTEAEAVKEIKRIAKTLK